MTSTVEASMRGAMQLPLDMLEMFDSAGASNKLFQWWQELEARIARTAEGSAPVPRAVRECAIRYIQCMADKWDCSRSSFFNCVALFDDPSSAAWLSSMPSVANVVAPQAPRRPCAPLSWPS